MLQWGAFVVHQDGKSFESADGLRLAVVVSTYHRSITDALSRGAIDAFTEAGGTADDLCVLEAPGTFELPVLCSVVITDGIDGEPVDGVIALGCVITGETTHDQYINNAVSTALANLSAQTGVPIGFGVLTCLNMQQAQERAGGSKGNKGAEAMRAVIATARSIERLSRQKERC